MDNTNYINLSRQATLWREIEVVSQNVANLNTNGYKAERMNFKEYVKSLDFGDGRLSFVQTRNISRNPEPGAVRTTGNVFDLALSGEGYFHIQTPLGDRYTRDGQFTLDADGRLVTINGLPVLDVDGDDIIIPKDAKDIIIHGDGSIVADDELAAQLAVVNFENPEALAKVGGNLYINVLQQEALNLQSGVVQGVVETSNVNPIIELTKLIEAHRSFEAIDTFIEREDERQGKRIEQFGRPLS